MDKRISINGIDFELYGEDINIKAIARVGSGFICAFNCESKYLDIAEEMIYKLMAKYIGSGKGLIECLEKLGNYQFTEKEMEEYI
ncbi:MAG: hypothetical protein ACTSQH_00115 [Candidatus Hodarchaeales archaeon]